MAELFKGHVVVVGASAAGISAAREIRKLNDECTVTIISSETHNPYYRPFLTEYMGDLEVEKKGSFYLNKSEWYDENNVELRLGERVTEINLFDKSLKTDKGADLSWDRLILATGATPFVPMKGALSYENVFAVRTFDDAKAVFEALEGKKKAVVIGGGLLGLEAAHTLSKRGLDVEILEMSGRILPLQLDGEGSCYLEKAIEEAGVKLRLSDVAESFSGDGRVNSVKLKSGEEIEADLVIFSIGVRPDISLAEGCRLETNRGIIVNERMETSHPGVYACGDAAEFNRTPALWMPAMKQGRVAGLNAIGEDAVFQSDDYPAMLNAFDTKVYSTGDISSESSHDGLITMKAEVKDEGIYKKLFFRNEKLVGGILIGDIKKSMAMLKAINGGSGIGEAYKLLT